MTGVAWHYRGSNGACVVIVGGAGVTKEPASDRFAAFAQMLHQIAPHACAAAEVAVKQAPDLGHLKTPAC